MLLHMSLLLTDLYDYEVNPAYTLAEAPHQKQGSSAKQAIYRIVGSFGEGFLIW